MEVIKLLGQGGFCEVHAARRVTPEAPTSSPIANVGHRDGNQKLYDNFTVTSMTVASTASHSDHSSPSYPTQDKKLEHLLGRDYCIKFLRPSVLAP